MRQFGTLPLMYQPGERWQYNVPAMVLGVLVARAAGQPLADDVRADAILEPLRMVETGFQIAASNVDRLPGSYLTDFATGSCEKQDGCRRPRSGSGRRSSRTARPACCPLWTTCSRSPGSYPVVACTKGSGCCPEESVRAMTTNCLTDEQIARGGALLGGRGWGYGMSVAVRPDDVLGGTGPVRLGGRLRHLLVQPSRAGRHRDPTEPDA